MIRPDEEDDVVEGGRANWLHLGGVVPSDLAPHGLAISRFTETVPNLALWCADRDAEDGLVQRVRVGAEGDEDHAARDCHASAARRPNPARSASTPRRPNITANTRRPNVPNNTRRPNACCRPTTTRRQNTTRRPSTTRRPDIAGRTSAARRAYGALVRPRTTRTGWARTTLCTKTTGRCPQTHSSSRAGDADESNERDYRRKRAIHFKG